MTRAEKIIQNARRILADPEGRRWSDDDLLAYLNEGQRDFCANTQIIKKRATATLAVGDPYFQVPEDCVLITRALYKNKVLPILSHHELDYKLGEKPSWETDEGEVEVIVYDRLLSLQGKVYPIPVDINYTDQVTEPSYMEVLDNLLTYTNLADAGVTSALENGLVYVKGTGDAGGLFISKASGSLPEEIFYGTETLDPNFGDIVDSDRDDVNNAYGITTDVSSYIDVQVSSPYGVALTLAFFERDSQSNDGFGVVVEPEVEPLEGVADDPTEVEYGVLDSLVFGNDIQLYYVALPLELDTLQGELSIPVKYDMALQYYVAGQAFLADNDAGSPQKGGTQLGIYDRHMQKAKSDGSRDKVQSADLRVRYRGAF